MPKHRKEDVEARIERVGQLWARRVPTAEIARSLNVSERQVRYDRAECLRRREAERAGEGLQLEEILVQCDEALQAAWRDYDLLGNRTSDSKVVRAKSELLRLALSIIDRQASLLGFPAVASGADWSSLATGSSPAVELATKEESDAARAIMAGYQRWQRETYRRMVDEAFPSDAQGEDGGGSDKAT